LNLSAVIWLVGQVTIGSQARQVNFILVPKLARPISFRLRFIGIRFCQAAKGTSSEFAFVKLQLEKAKKPLFCHRHWFRNILELRQIGSSQFLSRILFLE